MTDKISKAGGEMSGKDKEKTIKPLTRVQLRLIDVGVAIGMNQPTEHDAAYLARELVQCTLPYKNPGNDKPAWTRKNGNLSLTIRSGWDSAKGEVIGYPFGTLPRLLMFWMTTEAVRTKSRRLELGNSLSSFMTALGLNRSNGTGIRSDARRLRDQMNRLFRAQISFDRSSCNLSGGAWVDMQIAPEGQLWWDSEHPTEAALWGSWIELGEKFFQAIIAAPVPVDIRALRALKSSSLALDLYAWLTYESYRTHKSGMGRFISWQCLMEQMGTEYSTPKNFGSNAREALRKVLVVYPGLKLGTLRAGVRIEPETFPAIQPRDALASGVPCPISGAAGPTRASA